MLLINHTVVVTVRTPLLLTSSYYHTQFHNIVKKFLPFGTRYPFGYSQRSRSFRSGTVYVYFLRFSSRHRIMQIRSTVTFYFSTLQHGKQLSHTVCYLLCFCCCWPRKGPALALPNRSRRRRRCAPVRRWCNHTIPHTEGFPPPRRRWLRLNRFCRILPRFYDASQTERKTHPNEDKSEKPESFSALLCFLLTTTSSGNNKVRLGSD